MHKSFLFTCIIVVVLFAQNKPSGGYATLDHYQQGTVTAPDSLILLKSSAFSMSSDFVKVYYLRKDGKKRKWRNYKHGQLKIIVKPEGTFLFPESALLHIIGDYAWYIQVVTTTHSDGAGGHYTSSYTVTNVLNMKTGETSKLNKRFIRSLLSDTPELLEAFEEERRKNKKLKLYLEKYRDAKTTQVTL